MWLLNDPTTTECERWQFSSIHVLVNRQRRLLNLSKLRRCPTLDRMATRMAQEAILQDDLSVIQIEKHVLRALLGDVAYGAQLVHAGRPEDVKDGIRSFLHGCIQNEPSVRHTILSRNYREFGVGTAKNKYGYIVLVQLFRS